MRYGEAGRRLLPGDYFLCVQLFSHVYIATENAGKQHDSKRPRTTHQHPETNAVSLTSRCPFQMKNELVDESIPISNYGILFSKRKKPL